MEFKTLVARNKSGAVLPSASVYVYKPGTTTQVTIYNKAGASVSQPLTTNTLGVVSFRAVNGEYDVKITKASTSETLSSIEFYDGENDFADRAAMVSEWAKYTADSAAVPVGTIWTADGVSYEYDGTTTDISDLSGWKPVAPYQPGHFATNTTPGTTDMATAVQAMFDYDRDNGGGWLIIGEHYVGSTELTCYTSGDLSKGTLTTTAGGQSTPVLTIKSLSADISDNDATLEAAANADLPWTKGQSTISALSAYEGQSIRLASSDTYITRSGDSDYRTEVYFEVLDSEGNIYPPLPFDISGVTFTEGDRHVIREKIGIHLPTVKIGSGTTDRTESIINCERPNTVLHGGRVDNQTTAKCDILGRVNAHTGVTWYDGRMFGAKEASTNYAYKVRGAGHTFVNCEEGDCRRGFDGTYCIAPRIIGGCYPDGVGGHLVFGLKASSGAYLGYDAPNAASTFVAGGDTSVDHCTISVTGDGATALGVRSDVVEHIGGIRLTNNDIIFNLEGETGTPEVYLISMEAPGSSHSTGRAIDFPDSIIAQGNNILVTGTGHTGELRLLNIQDNYDNLTQDVNFETKVRMDNTIRWENGSPNNRIIGNKRSTWAGSGLDIYVDNLDDLDIYWGAETGTGNTTARANFWGRNLGAVTMNCDGGSIHKYLLDCQSFSRSTAIDATSEQGDEQWWHKINGGPPQRLETIADDAAFEFAPLCEYLIFDIFERNGSTTPVRARLYCDLAGTGRADVDGANATFGTYTTAVTGTTGTDAQFNFGLDATNDKIGLENRTGASLALAIIMHSQS